MAISPWEVEWSAERISNFWDAYSHETQFEARYFSRIIGHSVVREFSRSVKQNSIVLDFGAGKGYLTRHLLEKGYKVIALDSSKESIEGIRSTFCQHPNFLRAETLPPAGLPIKSSNLDGVLIVEVVEHLSAEYLSDIFSEFQRVLKRGGILFVTTPNAENLDAAKQMCPHCGCIFHPVQHLRSFNRESLAGELQEAGFRVVRCRETYLSHLDGFRRYTDRLRRFLGPDPWPHLVAVAKKL